VGILIYKLLLCITVAVGLSLIELNRANTHAVYFMFYNCLHVVAPVSYFWHLAPNVSFDRHCHGRAVSLQLLSRQLCQAFFTDVCVRVWFAGVVSTLPLANVRGCPQRAASSLDNSANRCLCSCVVCLGSLFSICKLACLSRTSKKLR